MPRSPVPDRLGRLMPLLAAIMAGGLLGAAQVAPFPTLLGQARVTGEVISGLFESRPPILGAITHPGSGVVVKKDGRYDRGLTLVQGLLPDGPKVWLIDADGKVRHRWDNDFFAIWPDASKVIPAKRIPTSKYRAYAQGMYPLPDGSLIVNFNALGSVRLDKCSRPIWRLDRPSHHSVTPTGDGRYWIPGNRSAVDTPKKYLPGGITAEEIEAKTVTDHYYHDVIRLVRADGTVEKEFSVLQAVYEAGLEGPLYASHSLQVTDATHVNDIEIVTPALAAKIKGIRTGDLLVSSRALSMLMILDQDSGRLKWYHLGPWLRQHDPDITPEGTIEIFNNRSPLIGETVTTSQVIAYDPADERVSVLAPVGATGSFYSEIMGAHQRLANGNMMITEAAAGRIFEVTPSGEIVWDYRLPYDDEKAALITYAMRVPNDYFATAPSCQRTPRSTRS